MSDKFKKIYKSLVSGAREGLADRALFQHVLVKNPKATSKKIVKASLLALTDPDLKDPAALHAIYALAIKHRVDPVSAADMEAEDEDEKDKLPAQAVA